jgi:hypothetical protein
MKTASRTLVTSPPELWELIDQPERMQGLMSALVGRATDIEVVEMEPEERLVWEARSRLEPGRIEVELAEKGFGTQIEVRASCKDEGQRLEGWLDAVLEELSTPQKRPFDGIV